jgi:hypothetical protein
MSGYVVAQIEQIDEIQDGRCPWRPVRHHLGVTAFGINAFTPARPATGLSTSTTRRRTAFAEQPGATIVAIGGMPGKAYEPRG